MKKRNIPVIPEIQKKHLAAAGIAVVFLLLILLIALRRGNKADLRGRTVEEDTISYSLRWLGDDYEGTYTGRTVNGKPEGTGVFTDKDGAITYSGEWKGGKLSGYGSVQYADGTHEEGMYLDGKRHHWIRRYDSDKDYKDGVYDFGNLYGCMSTFRDGSLYHETLIANGDHVSQIRKNAVKLTKDLIASKGYIDKYVYITGKIAYTEETETSCNYRIASDSVGMVICNYTNTAGYRSAQPVMPNMTVGQTITVFGFYTGLVRDELPADKDYYEYSCIQIDPVFGEPASGDNDRGTYASISRNPYSYCGKILEGDYAVEKFTKSGELFYVFVHPSGAEKEKYVLRIEAEPDEVFFGGETLNIKGFIVGQQKTEIWEKEFTDDDDDDAEEEIELSGYKKYPVIRVISFEHRK
jgi:hypothetical protein